MTNNELIIKFMSKDNYSLENEKDLDWNHLMPVVEKISNILSWSINGTLDYLSESQERDGLCTIDEVYEAVIEFINRHEQSNKYE